MNDRPIMKDQKIPANGAPAAVQYRSRQSHTTLSERVLIFITMVALPLENNIPIVAGMSSTFLLFATLGIYVILNRLRILGQVWLHPVFVAAYVFVGVSILLEFSSPLASYTESLRFGFMIGGAVLLSVLCRDRAGLAAGLYGYIATALWVSVYLYLTTYGMLKGIGPAESFHEASKIRSQVFEDKGLAANINTMAFLCAQGAIMAFALALVGSVKNRRILFLGIAAFCFIASFLPMSRGAAAGALVSFAVVLYAHGFKQGKVLIFASILGLTIYGLVPDAVWSRMVYTTQSQSGKMEGRAFVYTTALNRLPEYIVAGVGAGNFWNKWGFENGFSGEQRDGTLNVFGSHNVLLQVTIYWGIIGLLAYLWIVWCVYRAIPLRCGRDELSLALLGVVASIGVYLFLTQGFFDKPFACVVGMLIGARQWIWPTGIVSGDEVSQGPPSASIRQCHTQV